MEIFMVLLEIIRYAYCSSCSFVRIYQCSRLFCSPLTMSCILIWFYSFGSLYFAMQHVKLHWCFHWEVSPMGRNVFSLSMTGMQDLFQCMLLLLMKLLHISSQFFGVFFWFKFEQFIVSDWHAGLGRDVVITNISLYVVVILSIIILLAFQSFIYLLKKISQRHCRRFSVSESFYCTHSLISELCQSSFSRFRTNNQLNDNLPFPHCLDSLLHFFALLHLCF